MLFGNFDLKSRFCMGYRVSMMVHFQNALISQIFGVFSSGFLRRITVNDL